MGIFILLGFIFLNGCATSGSPDRHHVAFGSGIEKLEAASGFSAGSPATVAILPFENETVEKKAADTVRRSFYNHFASKKYRDVELHEIDAVLRKNNLYDGGMFLSTPPRELGKLLMADGLIYGKVTRFDKVFLGLYSRVRVGLEIRLVEASTGKVLWQARDTKTRHEGGVPLEPISAVPTLIRTALNVREATFLSASDDLCRNMAAALPEPSIMDKDGPFPTGQTAKGPAALDQSDPSELPRLMVQASRLMQAGDTGAAAVLYRRVIAANPDSAEANFLLGVCYFQAKKFDEAIAFMVKGSKLEPENAGYHYNLGLAYSQLGNRIASLTEWKKAVQLDPDNVSAVALIAYYKNAGYE